MSEIKRISNIFDYINPISADQVQERAFVDRLDLKERLSEETLRRGLLIVSGHSSIGKTTLINQATATKQLQTASASFSNVISVLVPALPDNGLLQAIYDAIVEFTAGKKLTRITPTVIANAMHTNRLLVILDGIHSLFDQPESSKDLYRLCKAWTDLHHSMVTQSKIILVASCSADSITAWWNQTGAAIKTRLPYTHVHLPPWSAVDLLKIIEKGAQQLGIRFDEDLQEWMTTVACGLPSTMTLLANLCALRANNNQDRIARETNLRVDLSDRVGVFGEGRKFHQVLYHDGRINNLSVPALLVLYLLGFREGSMPEEQVYRELESYRYSKDDVYDELEGLIFRMDNGEYASWNIMELSFGTFAYLRLYHRTNLVVEDAERIARILKTVQVQDSKVGSSMLPGQALDLMETPTGGTNMLTPEQQAGLVILQQAFTLVAGELKQRWQFAREQKQAKAKKASKAGKPAKAEKTPAGEAGVSTPLQERLEARLKETSDSAQLRMLTDNLKTNIKLAEDYNRLRNKIRQKLPVSSDSSRLELQIEDAEKERDKAVSEIQAIFEKLAGEALVIQKDDE